MEVRLVWRVLRDEEEDVEVVQSLSDEAKGERGMMEIGSAVEAESGLAAGETDGGRSESGCRSPGGTPPQSKLCLVVVHCP